MKVIIYYRCEGSEYTYTYRGWAYNDAREVLRDALDEFQLIQQPGGTEVDRILIQL